MSDSPKRINKNRATIALKPARVARLAKVQLNPLLLSGKPQTIGGTVGLLFEAAWPFFEAFNFDPIAVAAAAQSFTAESLKRERFRKG